MSAAFRRFARLPEQRWFALLLGVWLVAAQLLLAWHEVEHLTSGDDEACAVCLVGHGLDHAGTVSVALPPMVAAGFVAAVFVLVGVRPVTRVVYRSRAPPR